MAQQFRSLAAPVGDPSLIPSAHLVAHNYLKFYVGIRFCEISSIHVDLSTDVVIMQALFR